MATTDASVAPPLLTAEAAVSPPHAPESLGFIPIPHRPSNSHSQNLETLPPSPPPFLNSIAELKDLSAAISAFHHCYHDLHSHLDSIKDAILGKLSSEAPQITQPTASSPLSPDSVVPDESASPEQQKEEPNTLESELVDLCKSMCHRGVRRYLGTHLHRPMLREQVAEALTHAPNPPKLVLECLGKFYLQGSRAFTKDSPMIASREASILILECFLLMMGMDSVVTNGKDGGVLKIEDAVKREANAAAVAWRKRLLSEGGLAKASQIDARGLLLFVLCFGIPALFKMGDIRDLVMAGNAKEIVGDSHVMTRISDIVEEMLKKKKEVEAVDIVYSFGLEDRFNPHTILVSFLRESRETWKISKGARGSVATMNEANKKQLACLQSVSECLETHKIDQAKFLPGWQINETITSIEKEISKPFPERKRKPNEAETSSQKPKGQEAKRPRYPHGNNSHVMDRRNSLLDNYPATQAPVVYGGPGAVFLPQHQHQHVAPPTILPTYAVDAAGQLINTNRHHHPYIWHRDSGVDERYDDPAAAAASQPPPSAGVGLTSLYRGASSMSIEGFSGNNVNVNASSSIGGGRASGAGPSDLYHFADSVAETELLYTPAQPPPPHYHSSSYLYQV